MNLESVFAVPLGLSENIKHKTFEKKLVERCKKLKRQIKRGGTNWKVGTYNTCSTHNIHTDETFKELNQWVFNEIIEFANSIGYHKKGIACDASWFNFYKQYDYQEEHDHFAIHDIVAVYFLHGSLDTGNLILKSPLPYERTSVELVPNNVFTFNTYTIEPKPGKLVIFKSNLTHSVSQNRTKKDRISLAYNFSVK